MKDYEKLKKAMYIQITGDGFKDNMIKCKLIDKAQEAISKNKSEIDVYNFVESLINSGWISSEVVADIEERCCYFLKNIWPTLSGDSK